MRDIVRREINAVVVKSVPFDGIVLVFVLVLPPCVLVLVLGLFFLDLLGLAVGFGFLLLGLLGRGSGGFWLLLLDLLRLAVCLWLILDTPLYC